MQWFANGPTQPHVGSEPDQTPPHSLPRILSASETWGFGLTGLLLWLGAAPGAHAELGPQAIWVWIPSTIVGILLNLQVKELGRHWPDVAGGTPNYITRLLKDYPAIASFAGIGYYISWVAVLPVNAIILTDLIQANLEQVGIPCPEMLLRIGLTTIAFIVAFSGTRALGILHLCLVIPAVCLLLAFCSQGIGWLAVAENSPGFLPESWPAFDLQKWAKWYLIATYAVYACETASSFVADSRQPKDTLNVLVVAAAFIPPVYLGGSWVLMRLADHSGLSDTTFINLLTAATPFWGKAASFLVTFLIASGCLLSCATAVSNCPRILYQMALDAHLSPLFAVTSRQGVLAPGLILTLFLSLVFLIWGNVPQIVMITGIGWLSAFIILHGGIWLERKRLPIPWAWLSLGFCLIEIGVLILGSIAWSWQDLLMGLGIPVLILLGDRGIRHLSWPPLQPQWWIWPERKPAAVPYRDSMLLQVAILILLVCTAALVSWTVRGLLEFAPGSIQANLRVVVMLLTAFVAVTVACWTSLPQINAIQTLALTATAQAEQLELALNNLKQTQMQLVQTEKMSSLGQLVAGVAHEINNPVNFIHGNVLYTSQYTKDLLNLVELYQAEFPSGSPKIREKVEEMDLEFLAQDLPKILSSMKVGADRIQEIVQSLRVFSRLDESVVKQVDIHTGIDSTLLILRNRLKVTTPPIEVLKHYGPLPEIECYAGQLNQVFMNLLANAIDALEEAFLQKKPNQSSYRIDIWTECLQGDRIAIRIRDNGPGIPQDVQDKLFNPFFTTKPVGKGTGLGLSISYQIINDRHGGSLSCISSPNEGTEFRIEIPTRQSQKVKVAA